jgi:aminomethyltransferase
MKQTPFNSIHEDLGAKMAEFAGYNMPISYSGIKDEHDAVRNGIGMFDVSHMGEFILKGENALDLIQRTTSNDAAKLTNGKAQYSCMPNGKGGIVDDLLVYCVEENNVYMLVVNASNIEKDWNWLEQHNDKGVEMHNISDNTALLAVQGPKAVEAIQKLTDMDVINMDYYTFAKGRFCDMDNVLISATGYTGSGGVEIYFENEGADHKKVWNAIMEAGAEFDIKPAGLAARDTLRLEMGFALYGNDINDTTNPIEAGLGWITKYTKDFTDRALLEQVKADKPSRRLVGFEMVDRGIPRQHYKITDGEGNEIGEVTSGTQGPSVGKAIGMGYVKKGHGAAGNEIFISVRDKKLKATVVKVPFYKED